MTAGSIVLQYFLGFKVRSQLLQAIGQHMIMSRQRSVNQFYILIERGFAVVIPIARQKMIVNHINRNTRKTAVGLFEQTPRSNIECVPVSERIHCTMLANGGLYWPGKMCQPATAHEVATELAHNCGRVTITKENVCQEIHTNSVTR